MVYEYLVKSNQAAFLAKVAEVSSKLGIQADWLMIVMKMESGINPQAINTTGGATGLIQFMPSTAVGLGTSTAALYNMSNVEQMDWVYKYFKPYAGRLLSVTDLYMVTFFPVALGKPDNYVLQTSSLHADTIARQNPVFDLNKDQAITVGEFKQSVMNRLPNEAIQAILIAANNLKKN
jgi:hypothetical protein